MRVLIQPQPLVDMVKARFDAVKTLAMTIKGHGEDFHLAALPHAGFGEKV
jgi:hypothetical protein